MKKIIIIAIVFLFLFAGGVLAARQGLPCNYTQNKDTQCDPTNPTVAERTYCINNVCSTHPNVHEYCNPTDADNNEYVAASLSYRYRTSTGDVSQGQLRDSCANSASVQVQSCESNCRVFEYGCRRNPEPFFQNYDLLPKNCPGKCVNGACVQVAPASPPQPTSKRGMPCNYATNRDSECDPTNADPTQRLHCVNNVCSYLATQPSCFDTSNPKINFQTQDSVTYSYRGSQGQPTPSSTGGHVNDRCRLGTSGQSVSECEGPNCYVEDYFCVAGAEENEDPLDLEVIPCQRCVEGRCVPQQADQTFCPEGCDDDDPCTQDLCDTGMNECTHTSIPDCGMPETPCTDSDGNNLFNRGRAEGLFEMDAGLLPSSGYDYCTSERYGRQTEEGQYIVEFVCENNRPFANHTVCPRGYSCRQGVCAQQSVSPPIAPCSDSDGGLDYTVKGSVTGFSGRVAGTFTDFCSESTSGTGRIPSGRYVHEYLCRDNLAVGRTYECPGGCVDGKCVPQPLNQCPITTGTIPPLTITVGTPCEGQALYCNYEQDTVLLCVDGTFAEFQSRYNEFCPEIRVTPECSVGELVCDTENDYYRVCTGYGFLGEPQRENFRTLCEKEECNPGQMYCGSQELFNYAMCDNGFFEYVDLRGDPQGEERLSAICGELGSRSQSAARGSCDPSIGNFSCEVMQDINRGPITKVSHCRGTRILSPEDVTYTWSGYSEQNVNQYCTVEDKCDESIAQFRCDYSESSVEICRNGAWDQPQTTDESFRNKCIAQTQTGGQEGDDWWDDVADAFRSMFPW